MLRHKNVDSGGRAHKFLAPSLHSILLTVLVATYAGTAWADAPGTTLKSAVQQALDENPEIRSRVEAFYASKHDRREAFGGYLPSVDANVSVGTANREYDRRGSFSRNYGEISLTQMLFDGFRVKNRVKRFDHLSRARYYELLDEMENKTLEVADAYLGVRRYREMVKLAQRNLDNHMKTYENVLQRSSTGVGNAADLQQVRGRLALARSNMMTEQANLQTVTARYQRLVGSVPGDVQESVFSQRYAIPAGIKSMLRTS